MRVRTTALLLCAGFALTGCVSVVEGAGHGSGAPSSSVSTPASPTATGPTAFPSSAAPGAALVRRTPASTAAGDPVVADFCRTEGTAFLKPLGYPIALSSIRYAAGCTFRGVSRTNNTQVGVTEYANAPTQAHVRLGGRFTTVHGLRVHVLPLDAGGECVRDVYAAGMIVNIVGYALGAPRTSPKICQAADLTVQRLTALLAARARFATLSLAADTVYNLNMCKIAAASGLVQDTLFQGAAPQTNYYGADCYLSTPQLFAYIDVATSTPAAAVREGSKSVTSEGHAVLQRTSAAGDSCTFFATQGAVSDGSGVEMIEFDIKAMNSKKPPAEMCPRALASIGRFLDAGGLR